MLSFFFCTRSLSITFRCKTLSKSSIEAKRLLFTKVQVHSPRITISFFLCSELKGAFTVCPKTALQCDRRYLSNNYDEGGFFSEFDYVDETTFERSLPRFTSYSSYPPESPLPPCN